jgi:RNA polymerase sigma-70 factor (ECF subfamily)
MPEPAMTLAPPQDAAAGPPARAASPDPDAALVARAREGDAAAFRALVERHRDRAYAVALRITRSPAEAAEAAQEGLVRAWVALPDFRGEAAFGTWLHRVVARRALDRAEALARRRGREVGVEAALQEADGAAAPGDPLAAARLARLLGRLTPAQRAVVTLFYLEERRVEDVAAALGMPGNTVKTHLHRARAALRQAWIEEEGEP